MERVISSALAATMILGVSSCASKVPKPTPVQLEVAQQRWPEATLDELTEGRRLYLRRCGDCHALPHPTSRSEQAWPAIVKDMGEYSQFDTRQTELVLRWIISARATPAPPADAR